MEAFKADVIVPAAGIGSRMGLEIPKQYALLAGKTILEHTVSALLSSPQVANVIIAVRKDDRYFDDLKLADNPRVIKTYGGKERDETVFLSLPLVKTPWVFVHDAARPMIDPDDILSLSKLALSSYVGGILASKVADTLKLVENQSIIDNVPRERIFRAFTPQLFKTEVLKQALSKVRQCGLKVTDDASAVQLLGYEVKIVEGRGDNFKITTKEDLLLARALFAYKREQHNV